MGGGRSRTDTSELSKRLVSSTKRCTEWHMSLGRERHRIEAAIRGLGPHDTHNDALVLAKQLKDVIGRMEQVRRVNTTISALRDQSMQLHHQVDIEQSMRDLLRGIEQVESAMGTPQLARLAAQFDEATTRLGMRMEMVGEDLASASSDPADALPPEGAERESLERLLLSVRQQPPAEAPVVYAAQPAVAQQYVAAPTAWGAPPPPAPPGPQEEEFVDGPVDYNSSAPVRWSPPVAGAAGVAPPLAALASSSYAAPPHSKVRTGAEIGSASTQPPARVVYDILGAPAAPTD